MEREDNTEAPLEGQEHCRVHGDLIKTGRRDRQLGPVYKWVKDEDDAKPVPQDVDHVTPGAGQAEDESQAVREGQRQKSQ